MSGNPQRGGALKGVMIGLAVLTVLFISSVVAVVVFFARDFHVQESRSADGKTVKIETPLGSMRVNEDAKFSPKDLGVALYPGATPINNGAKQVDLAFSFGDEARVNVQAAEFTTPDPVDKVFAWYTKELPNWNRRDKGLRHIQLETSDAGQHRMVSMRPSHEGTRITIAQVGAPAVN